MPLPTTVVVLAVVFRRVVLSKNVRLARLVSVVPVSVLVFTWTVMLIVVVDPLVKLVMFQVVFAVVGFGVLDTKVVFGSKRSLILRLNAVAVPLL